MEGVGEDIVNIGDVDEVSPASLVVTIVRDSEKLISLTDELVGRVCSVTKNNNKFVNS